MQGDTEMILLGLPLEDGKIYKLDATIEAKIGKKDMIIEHFSVRRLFKNGRLGKELIAKKVSEKGWEKSND